MADETMAEDVFMAHMERAVRRSQEIWPDDWRNHHTFYDGEVARLLDTLRQADEPRAIVRAFARAMERKLAAALAVTPDDLRTVAPVETAEAGV